MFQRVLSRSNRSLLAVLVALVWMGASTTGLQAQEKAAKEAHPPAEAAADHAAKAEAHADKAADHAAKADVHAAAADGHADAAHGDAHGGTPPGPIEWKTDLALWTLIVFGIFVVILKVGAWGPLSNALNAREHKIKSDISHAEESRIKAEKMLAEYQTKLAAAQEEVLKVLAEARNDAEHTRKEIMAQTEKEVSAMKERALLEIGRTKDQALEELFNHMAGAVANATERVLGRALTDADQDRLISDTLAEFSRGQAS